MRRGVPHLRRAFLTGLVVLIPVAVTTWVLWLAVRMVDGWISPWIARTPWLKDNLPQAAGTALGFVAVILFITLVGAVANSLFRPSSVNDSENTTSATSRACLDSSSVSTAASALFLSHSICS